MDSAFGGLLVLFLFQDSKLGLGFLTAQSVKSLPANVETRFSSGRKIPEKKWRPLVALPGKCHGQRSLSGYSPRAKSRHD